MKILEDNTENLANPRGMEIWTVAELKHFEGGCFCTVTAETQVAGSGDSIRRLPEKATIW
jgi:hypothetical protein